MDNLIYFDYAATTPVRPEAIEAMLGALGQFGNPSSRYEFGRESARRVKEHRDAVAEAFGCSPSELFFTSCGTEGDNWAIRRGVELNRRRGKHIVTTAIEHAAVLETCKELERQGYEVTYLKPDRAGRVAPEQLAAAKDSDPSEDIKAALTAQISKEEAQQAQPAPEKPAPRLVAVGPDDDVPPMPDDLEPLAGQGQDEFELDPDATRRYSDLQFGKDYEIQ